MNILTLETLSQLPNATMRGYTSREETPEEAVAETVGKFRQKFGLMPDDVYVFRQDDYWLVFCVMTPDPEPA